MLDSNRDHALYPDQAGRASRHDVLASQEAEAIALLPSVDSLSSKAFDGFLLTAAPLVLASCVSKDARQFCYNLTALSVVMNIPGTRNLVKDCLKLRRIAKDVASGPGAKFFMRHGIDLSAAVRRSTLMAITTGVADEARSMACAGSIAAGLIVAPTIGEKLALVAVGAIGYRFTRNIADNVQLRAQANLEAAFSGAMDINAGEPPNSTSARFSYEKRGIKPPAKLALT